MPTQEQLLACEARLLKHRSRLRSRRMSAWFYKRKSLEAKVYARLAKLQVELDRLAKQLQRRS